MTRAAIGLGSNLGDRWRYLLFAVQQIDGLGEVVATSSVYETEPIGEVEQGSFLNAVVVLETRLDARHLLRELQAIESEAGRQRATKWGPRTLDLDLLIYGREQLAEVGLAVPHPRLTERRFVLEPLLEAWPEVELPNGDRLAKHLDGVECQAVESVGRLDHRQPRRTGSQPAEDNSEPGS